MTLQGKSMKEKKRPNINFARGQNVLNASNVTRVASSSDVPPVWCLPSSGRQLWAPWTRTQQTAALCTSTTPWWPHFPPTSAGTTVRPPLTLCPAWSARASLEGPTAASWSVCATKNSRSADLIFFMYKVKVWSMRYWWQKARIVTLLNLSLCHLVVEDVEKRANKQSTTFLKNNELTFTQ